MHRTVAMTCVGAMLAAGVADAAIAADLKGMPTSGLVSVGERPSIWNGLYAGVGAGYASGDSDAQEINGPRNYIANFDGAAGFVYVGWQKQLGRLVGGVELAAGYLGVGSHVTRDVTGGSIASGADFGAYGSLSARLGLLATPTLLLYARGGVALADVDAATVQTCSDGTLCGGAQTTSVSEARSDSPTWGLLLGTGLEKQLTNKWTARLEYQYFDFREELALPPIDGPGWNQDADIHAVSAGLSYRF